jgi:hypothetical protein
MFLPMFLSLTHAPSLSDLPSSCKNEKQLMARWAFTEADLRETGCGLVADWFINSQLTGDWIHWGYQASNVPGVPPNTNMVEAYWRMIKNSDLIPTNRETWPVLHTQTIPMLIKFTSKEYSGVRMYPDVEKYGLPKYITEVPTHN